MPAVLTLLGEVFVAILDLFALGDLRGELILNLGDEEMPALLFSGELIMRPSLFMRSDGLRWI